MSSNFNNIGSEHSAPSTGPKGNFANELRASNDVRRDVDMITGQPKSVRGAERASAPGRKQVMKGFTNKDAEGFNIISNSDSTRPPNVGKKKKPEKPLAGKVNSTDVTTGSNKTTQAAQVLHEKDFDVVTGKPKAKKATLAKKGSYKKIEESANDPYDVMGNPKKKLEKQSSSGKLRQELMENGNGVDPITGKKKQPAKLTKKASAGSLNKEIAKNSKNTNPITGTDKTPPVLSGKEPTPSARNKAQPIKQTNPLTGEDKPFKGAGIIPSAHKADAKSHSHVDPITGQPKRHREIKKSTSGSMRTEFLAESASGSGFNIINGASS